MRQRVRSLLLPLLLPCAICTGAMAHQPSERLLLTGAAREKLEVDAAALAAFPTTSDIGQFTRSASRA